MDHVAGIDGCRAGWIIAFIQGLPGSLDLVLEGSFSAVLQRTAHAQVVAIDVPIGLLDEARAGGRACDTAARRLLRPRRSSSVFSPPVRAALAHQDDYWAALEASRGSSPEKIGLSKQSFNILPRIAEVDQAIQVEDQARIREALPELSFYEANQGRVMPHGKRNAQGIEERFEVLHQLGVLHLREAVGKVRFPGVRVDDALDATINAWTALRIAQGDAIAVPTPTRAGEPVERDSRGLAMEIWR